MLLRAGLPFPSKLANLYKARLAQLGLVAAVEVQNGPGPDGFVSRNLAGVPWSLPRLLFFNRDLPMDGAMATVQFFQR